MDGHFRQQGIGSQGKHAAVPEVAATGQVLFGGLQVRLFHKTLHLGSLTTGNIAIPGLGMIRDDAEGDDPALAGELCRLGHRPGKGFGFANEMICREYQQHILSAT